MNNNEKRRELIRYQSLVYAAGGGEQVDRERYITSLVPPRAEPQESTESEEPWTRAIAAVIGSQVY